MHRPHQSARRAPGLDASDVAGLKMVSCAAETFPTLSRSFLKLYRLQLFASMSTAVIRQERPNEPQHSSLADLCLTLLLQDKTIIVKTQATVPSTSSASVAMLSGAEACSRCIWRKEDDRSSHTSQKDFARQSQACARSSTKSGTDWAA